MTFDQFREAFQCVAIAALLLDLLIEKVRDGE